MDLSIVIVNWNSREYLRKCLHSLPKQSKTLKYEAIVIDSGSFDGCAQMLRESFPSVIFIQGEKNVGFARANNKACEVATGNCLLFLNPDTELSTDCLEKLHSEWKTLPKPGAVGCRLLNTDGSTQTSCIQSFPNLLNQILDSDVLRTCFPKSILWGIGPLLSDAQAPSSVDVVSGACLLVGRKEFSGVKGFSEDYFMYSEDVDLCHKLARNGLQNYFLPSTTVLHHCGGSSAEAGAGKFSAVMMRESRAMYFEKTRGLSYSSAYRVAMGMSALLRLGLLSVKRVFEHRTDAPALSRSLNKWRAIFRWSLGLESWLEQYK